MRKLVYLLVFSIFTCCLLQGTLADLSVGVKRGDWIEYAVSYTGQPTLGHDIVGARMEIVKVEGSAITVTISSTFSNGTTDNTTSTLNLQTGHLIDDFIIPANLTVGDAFLDENLGNVTITGTDQHIYAGASRTIVSASTTTNTYVWDQATGVSVEGIAQTPEYTIHTIVSATNMWQPPIGVGYTVIVLTVVFLLIIVVVIAAVISHFRKKPRHKQLLNKATN
jgi:hypothetical protein